MKTIRDVAGAVKSWLLGPHAQIAEGSHRGGVVGWLNARSEPVFVYPESTGYYLTWLAFLTKLPDSAGDAAGHAAEAIQWISRYLSEDMNPPTRIYLSGNPADDWRNHGTFAFDLAMLARGMAQHVPGNTQGPGALAQLFDLLLPFCGEDDSIQAFRPHAGCPAASPQPGWSSCCGAYQTKLAAAILLAHSISEAPARLHVAADRTYRRWREYSRCQALDGNTHSAFYHLEGLVLAGAAGWDPDATDFARDAFLKGLRTPGSPCRSADSFYGTPLNCRSDVCAQALRLGCMLRSRNVSTDRGLDPALRGLAEALQTFIGDNGAVRFSHQNGARHYNVWCAMFAHQALCFYDSVQNGKAPDDGWLRLLV